MRAIPGDSGDMTALAGERGRVTAVLGPTNTGKTHLAVERMLAYRTGMIGFPLRLLAREIYDRVVALNGRASVALVTGEEKRVPPHPRYFICTVESMPLDRAVDFVAIDEIQLAADRERGHVFTDRLLHMRGRIETMLLGAATIRPLVRRLVPDAEFVIRPRFSKLSYAGTRKLSRLPPRTAIVAFSAASVYAVAEQMRRQRGGCAVVLGALSPSTRNAQVAMYQAGEVDYLVATDAIGMGLNMDVNHVAFGSLSKFDGQHTRRLQPAEVAQVAGRAGRHVSDGTFGGTDAVEAFDPDLVEAIESHQFAPLHALQWRNSALDFRSIHALSASLAAPPPARGLMRTRTADDSLALELLAADPDVIARARHPGAVRRLWDICQIPDFRKLSTESHAGLLKRVFLHLATDDGRLPDDWVARQVARLDRVDGDIETLMGRIAGIRLWTYITHRGDWLVDAKTWQARSRSIEDRLSDALHDRLTQRFVDRRAARLARGLRADTRLLGTVTSSGEVVVEGHEVGRLEGFRFRPDRHARGEEARLLGTAARRILADAFPPRIARMCAETDSAFALDKSGTITWNGAPIALFRAGDTPLAPRIELLSSDLLNGPQRERLRQRLILWRDAEIPRRLPALDRLAQMPLTGAAQGLAYQLTQGLGLIATGEARAQIDALTADDRKALARAGVRLGRFHVFIARAHNAAQLTLRARLWATISGWTAELPLPAKGRVSMVVDAQLPATYYATIGYPVFGPRAVRADIVERLAAQARRLAAGGPFAIGAGLASLAGCPPQALALVLAEMGFQPLENESGGALRFALPARRDRTGTRPRKNRRRTRTGSEAASPFASLRGHIGNKNDEGR